MPRRDASMSRRNAEFFKPPAGLTGKAVFGFLNLVTGHGQVLEVLRPDFKSRNSHRVYPNARTKSNFQPPPITPSLVARERPLTPTPKSAKLFSCDDQEQSPLLKLPETALDLIYTYVLGDRLVHIVKTGDCLGHTNCQGGKPNQHEKCHEERCRGVKLPSGLHMIPLQSQEGLLPLLQTCRKM